MNLPEVGEKVVVTGVDPEWVAAPPSDVLHITLTVTELRKPREGRRGACFYARVMEHEDEYIANTTWRFLARATDWTYIESPITTTITISSL